MFVDENESPVNFTLRKYAFDLCYYISCCFSRRKGHRLRVRAMGKIRRELDAVEYLKRSNLYWRAVQ